MADNVPDIDHDKLPQQLTAQALENWIPAQDALQMASTKIGTDFRAANELVGRLERGLIRAGAKNHFIQDTKPTETRGFIEIEDWRWGSFEDSSNNAMWATGTVILKGRLVPSQIGRGYATREGPAVEYFGVRFEPTGLAEVTGASISAITSPVKAAEKHAGGRPSYDWDSIWAAVGARLAAGWKPSQQKDIEAEMKAQAKNLGMDPVPGRTAIQERARKLGKTLGLKD